MSGLLEDASLYPEYDNDVAVALDDGETNLSIWPSENKVTLAAEVIITSDEAISVRLNSPTNPAIPIAASTPRTIQNVAITKIFGTNSSGSNATLTIWMVGR